MKTLCKCICFKYHKAKFNPVMPVQPSHPTFSTKVGRLFTPLTSRWHQIHVIGLQDFRARKSKPKSLLKSCGCSQPAYGNKQMESDRLKQQQEAKHKEGGQRAAAHRAGRSRLSGNSPGLYTGTRVRRTSTETSQGGWWRWGASTAYLVGKSGSLVVI